MEENVVANVLNKVTFIFNDIGKCINEFPGFLVSFLLDLLYG